MLWHLLLARVAYAVANPVEANLVRTHREWRGLWAFAGRSAWRRSFTFFHEGRYRRAVAWAEGRDEAPPVSRAEFQETVTLEIGGVDAGLAEAIGNPSAIRVPLSLTSTDLRIRPSP